MEKPLEKLTTSAEVAEALGIHPKVLERMAARGEVPALKVGRFWRYRASDVAAWIESRVQSRAATVPHGKTLKGERYAVPVRNADQAPPV